MDDVQLVAHTVVNWGPLLNLASQVLGRSLTAHLDAAGISLDGASSWIAALGGLRHPGDRPGIILADPGSLLRHASATFSLVLREETLLSLLEDGGVSVVSGETTVRGVRLAVATGTFEQWRAAVISGCSAEAPPDLRALLGKVMDRLHGAGLGWLWGDCARQQQPDKTFTLGPKK